MSTKPDGPRPSPRRNAWIRRAVGVALAAIVLVFVIVAVANNWTAVRSELRHLPISAVVVSGLFGVVALCFAAASWYVALSALAPPLPLHDASTIYFAGQLGKYVPGSVWPAVIQAQLGRRHNISRTTMLTGFVVAMTLSVGAGGAVGLLALVGGASTSVVALAVGAALGAGVLVAAVLHERGLQRWLQPLIVRTGRTLPQVDLPARAGLLAGALSVASWCAFGVHAWCIARPLGADISDLLPCIGAFALAFIAGLAVIPLPAGAGVREAVLILVLGASLGRPGAIALALVSRFVLMIAEVAIAAVTGVPGAIRWARQHPDDGGALASADEVTPG